MPVRRRLRRVRLRRAEIRDRRVVAVPAAELERGDEERAHNRDPAEGEQDAAAFEAFVALVDGGGPPGHDRLAQLVLADRVARVVFVDVELSVEPEVVRVRAQEALDIGLGGKRVEAFLFERLQVPSPDLGRLLDVREFKLLPVARLAQAVADLEHGRWPILAASSRNSSEARKTRAPTRP